MTREEAINEIKSWDFLEGKKIDVIHTLIPELKESKDERIRKRLIEYFEGFRMDDAEVKWEGLIVQEVLAWLEKQKEQEGMITVSKEAWDENAKDSFERGIKVGMIRQQKEQKNKFVWISVKDELPYTTDYVITCVSVRGEPNCIGLASYSNDAGKWFDIEGDEDTVDYWMPIPGFENSEEKQKEQTPAEWNDTDMKEARDNLISVCRDWERGEQTTLLPVVAVRARYFLEHLTEPKPAEWSKEDEKMFDELLEFLHFRDPEHKYSNWLKSLRPQPKQEWNEDKNKLDKIHSTVQRFIKTIK